MRAGKGQEGAGVDRDPHEVEAGGAQRRKVGRPRHRPVLLEGRPRVIGARRGKFARQAEPGPGVDAASKARRRVAGDGRAGGGQRRRAAEEGAPVEAGPRHNCGSRIAGSGDQPGAAGIVSR